ncbi:mandelate racemase/muconate lactonizing enzyme family protein [Consotaella salsifontis]|uniref:L-alanine-DL-glutamate epimerase n=1 Tax=Consotaella salsifontis TaxID=1365950 RepID=A0A1T4S754_9HYPH|nr:mandelate racemase/muconate lactonizing enzyme family protein [Consotaella salsifontis]SKA24065.1 L-alanine-DL-glutamate epimerase [Consotaella salsifontis]
MKITGYRSLTTTVDWGRPIGDVNGVIETGVTEVPILILETDIGVTGVGLGGHADIARVFPALEGEDPRAATALYDRMQAFVFKSGHGGSVFGAIGVADMALWDLKAKLAGEPLWRLLGGRDRKVSGYASALDYGLGDDELVALYETWAERGFTAAKLKGGREAGADVRRLLAVRDVLSRNSRAPAMMLDVNESLSRKQAVRHLALIEEKVDLSWIEEPVRRWDVDGHLAVGRGARAAVATGENLTGLEQYRPFLSAAAVDIVQAGSCWGITHFLRVAALAHAYDLPVSPVGYNTNPVAHAAAAVPNLLSHEIQDLGAPFGVDVDQEIVDGSIILGDRPGLGLEIDERAIAARSCDASWTTVAGPHVRPPRAGLRLVPDGGE